MIDNWMKQKALEILVIMNTAIVNLRLYPPTSSMIINTVDRLYQNLQMAFEREPSLIISEADKNLRYRADRNICESASAEAGKKEGAPTLREAYRDPFPGVGVPQSGFHAPLIRQ